VSASVQYTKQFITIILQILATNSDINLKFISQNEEKPVQNIIFRSLTVMCHKLLVLITLLVFFSANSAVLQHIDVFQ
jgi:hypothetical protein